MALAVKTENLYYTYEDGTRALNGIDLTVKTGEKVAVMGANGSGKSTFFLTLNGVLKPEKGRVFISGKPIRYSGKGLLEVRKKVGIVFQNPDDQLFSASVKQDISFGLFNLGLSREEVEYRTVKIMEEMRLMPFAEKPTHFLSGGQKKRAALAGVLVMEPEVLLLDEPAAALDPRHKGMIEGLVDSLSEKGITVIMSTHDGARALEWADRVVIFDKGKIIGQGRPEEILQDEKLLTQANLEEPVALRMFRTLCRSGILDSDLEMPRSVEQLEQYIRERSRSEV